MAVRPRDIIARFAPKKEEYQIRFSEEPDDFWLARPITNVRELTEISQQAADMVKMSDARACPPAWKAFLPLDIQTATAVIMICAVVIEPECTHQEILEMCQESGTLVMQIFNLIQSKQNPAVSVYENTITDDAKNASLPMVSSGATSPLAEKFSDSTLKNGAKTAGGTPLTSSPLPS